MEFDTNIILQDCGSVEIESSKDYEALLGDVWDVLSSVSKNVGEGTGGEFWVDFSDTLKTKYIVCKVSPAEDVSDSGSSAAAAKLSSEASSAAGATLSSADGVALSSEVSAPAGATYPRKYVIRLRCGKKSGRLGDAFMMVFALGVFWFFSKVVVPDALLSNYVALGTCLALLAANFVHIQLPFGTKESTALLAKLKEL